MTNRNKAHLGIKYRLSEVGDPEIRQRLEHNFIAVEALKREQVSTMREAQRQAALATKAMAEVAIAELNFLIAAGDADELTLVTTEPNWIIRRNGEGEVLLECLITQNDAHKVAKSQTHKLQEQLNEAPIDPDDESHNGMFSKD